MENAQNIYLCHVLMVVMIFLCMHDYRLELWKEQLLQTIGKQIWALQHTLKLPGKRQMILTPNSLCIYCVLVFFSPKSDELAREI